MGANGTISVTANICSDKVQAVYDYVQKGDYTKALNIQNELAELNTALFIETNPIPLKTVLAEMGKIKEDVRMPLVQPTTEHKSLLVKLAEKLANEQFINKQ